MVVNVLRCKVILFLLGFLLPADAGGCLRPAPTLSAAAGSSREYQAGLASQHPGLRVS